MFAKPLIAKNLRYLKVTGGRLYRRGRRVSNRFLARVVRVVRRYGSYNRVLVHRCVAKYRRVYRWANRWICRNRVTTRRFRARVRVTRGRGWYKKTVVRPYKRTYTRKCVVRRVRVVKRVRVGRVCEHVYNFGGNYRRASHFYRRIHRNWAKIQVRGRRVVRRYGGRRWTNILERRFARLAKGSRRVVYRYAINTRGVYQVRPYFRVMVHKKVGLRNPVYTYGTYKAALKVYGRQSRRYARILVKGSRLLRRYGGHKWTGQLQRQLRRYRKFGKFWLRRGALATTVPVYVR